MTQALVDAATVAGYAPSIHHTQPWRWRVTRNRLDLFTDRDRAPDATNPDATDPDATDPDALLATLSCGAALHHARTGLAAQGWQVTVTRMPDPADPGHLARLRVDGRAPVELQAVRRTHTIRLRHTDRRPVTGHPIGSDDLRAINAAVRVEATLLHILRPDQVLDLATGHDHNATYAVLYGCADQPMDWLRAGEAMSSAWLTATELGVSVLPISASDGAAGRRQIARRLAAKLGHPYLVLRLGMLDTDDPGPVHAPRRRPATQTIDRPWPADSRSARLRSQDRPAAGR